MIARHFGIDRKLLYITEAHYYRGRFRASDANKRNLLMKERQFEDSLIENDIIFHYKHLRPQESGGINRPHSGRSRSGEPDPAR